MSHFISITKKIIVPLILLSTGYWFYGKFKKDSSDTDADLLSLENEMKDKGNKSSKRMDSASSNLGAQTTQVTQMDDPSDSSGENDNKEAKDQTGPMSPEEFKTALQTNIESLKKMEEKCKNTWEELEASGPIARSPNNWSDNIEDAKEVLQALKKGNCFHNKGRQISNLFNGENVTEENFPVIKETLTGMDMALGMSNRFKEMSVIRKITSTLKTNKDPELMASFKDLLETKAKNISNLYEGLMLFEQLKDAQKAGLIAKNYKFEEINKQNDQFHQEIEKLFKDMPINEQKPEEVTFQQWSPLQKMEGKQVNRTSEEMVAIIRESFKTAKDSTTLASQ